MPMTSQLAATPAPTVRKGVAPLFTFSVRDHTDGDHVADITRGSYIAVIAVGRYEYIIQVVAGFLFRLFRRVATLIDIGEANGVLFVADTAVHAHRRVEEEKRLNLDPVTLLCWSVLFDLCGQLGSNDNKNQSGSNVASK